MSARTPYATHPPPQAAVPRDFLARTVKVIVWLVFAVGMMQYVPTVVDGVLSGNFTRWALSGENLEDAGVVRYIKDAYLLAVSFVWPLLLTKIFLPKPLQQMVKGYGVWLLLVFVFGFVPYMYSDTPAFVAIAGLRWLLLLHAAFGVFILSAANVTLKPGRSPLIPLSAFAIFLVINLVVAALQFGQIDEGAFGNVRAYGLFANAGVLSALAVGLAAVGLAHPGASRRSILVYTVTCWLVAAFTGSRHGMICITFIIMYAAFLPSYMRQSKRNRLGMGLVILLVSPLFMFLGYQYLNDLVGRGDLLSQQFGEGGRAANLASSLADILDADWSQIFFGAGLGVGTNSSYTLSVQRDIVPESIPFNYLVDNGMVTLLFQIGFIGSAVFWSGFALFFLRLRLLLGRQAGYILILFLGIFLLTMLAGNFFEQIYLMMGFAVAMGYLLRYPSK